MVHKVEDCLQVSELHPIEVEEGVLVWVLPEDGPEEGGQNELVCLDLPGPTAQGAVQEIFLLSDLSGCNTNVALEVNILQLNLCKGAFYKKKLNFF